MMGRRVEHAHGLTLFFNYGALLALVSRRVSRKRRASRQVLR